MSKLFCALALSLLESRLTNESVALVKLVSIIAATVVPFDAAAVTVSMAPLVHQARGSAFQHRIILLAVTLLAA